MVGKELDLSVLVNNFGDVIEDPSCGGSGWKVNRHSDWLGYCVDGREIIITFKDSKSYDLRITYRDNGTFRTKNVELDIHYKGDKPDWEKVFMENIDILKSTYSK